MPIAGRGARVDPEPDVGVAPGARAHRVRDVADGVFGEEDGRVGGELVGEAAARPDRAAGEDGEEDGYQAAEVVGFGF